MYRGTHPLSLIIAIVIAALLGTAGHVTTARAQDDSTSGAALAEMAGPANIIQLRTDAIQLIYLKDPIKRASIGNPKIADIVVVSPREIQVIGRKDGETTMILWDERNEAYSYHISVTKHVARQVLLRAKIGLLDRTLSRQMGVDGIFTGDNVTAGAFWGRVVSPAVPLELNQLANAYISHAPSHVEAVVQFMSSKGLLKVLAEPNLLSRSGEEASFLVGGEFPYIVPQTGGQGNTTTFTVNYKEFGTRLTFTPTVLESGVIELRVSPEVSDLDFTQGLSLLGTNIPAIRTRKVETVVELKNKESLIIAGLIEQKEEDVRTGVPGLKEIPILGYLFRRTEQRRTETELMVIITPYLVRGSYPGPQNVPADELKKKRKGTTDEIMQWELETPRGTLKP